MIRVYQNPTPKTREELLMRPALESVKLDDTVMEILNDVKENGNNSLLSYASKFDGVELDYINVSDKEIQTASISKELEEAIKLAKSNIEKFHSKQIIEEPVVETIEGVKCWRKSVPIEKVGLYIPGGSAPLFSTVLMLGVPAMLAGCEEVILCTPPDKEGKIDPAILFTAQLIGIKKLFKVGGAQA
ncbi:MAG: histidinol dehydrogenase, partial [Bacteroidota bacterium]